jgi:hypothetical protein
MKPSEFLRNHLWIIAVTVTGLFFSCGGPSESGNSNSQICVPECSEDQLCINGTCKGVNSSDGTPESDAAPAEGSDLDCVDILSCVADAECPDEKDSCYREKCVNHGTQTAQDRFLSFVECFRNNECTSASEPRSCMTQKCSTELGACVQTARGEGNSSSEDVDSSSCTPNIADRSCIELSAWNDDTTYAAAGISDSEGSTMCGARGTDPNYSGSRPNQNFHWGHFQFKNTCNQPVHVRICVYLEYASVYTEAAWWCSHKSDVSPGTTTGYEGCYNDHGPAGANRYQRGILVTPASNPASCVRRCPGGLANCTHAEIQRD